MPAGSAHRDSQEEEILQESIFASLPHLSSSVTAEFRVTLQIRTDNVCVSESWRYRSVQIEMAIHKVDVEHK